MLLPLCTVWEETELEQNDPNSLFIDANGTYHLYYQCKSASIVSYLLLRPLTLVVRQSYWSHGWQPAPRTRDLDRRKIETRMMR